MKLRARTRSVILAGGLGLTLLLVYGVGEEQTADSAVVDATASPRHSLPERRGRADGDFTNTEFPKFDSKAALAGIGSDLLQPTTWWAPMPSPPQSTMPVEPQAPPALPYRFRGMLLADGQVTGVIEKQGEQSMVHVGDVLDNLYRVEDIATEGLTLTYLPLNAKQMSKMQDN